MAESRYKIIRHKDNGGFTITGEDRRSTYVRLFKTYWLVNPDRKFYRLAKKSSYLNSFGRAKYCPILDYYQLTTHIADSLMANWKEKIKNKSFNPKVWATTKCAKALSGKICRECDEIIQMRYGYELTLYRKRHFALTRKLPSIDEATLFKLLDLFQNPKIRSELQRFPFFSLAVGGVEGVDEALRWRQDIAQYANQKPNRAWNITVDNIRANCGHHLQDFLRINTRLHKPLLKRTELLMNYYWQYHNAIIPVPPCIKNASNQQLIEAFKVYKKKMNEKYYPQQCYSDRQIRYFINQIRFKDISNYKGDIVSFVQKNVEQRIKPGDMPF